MKLRLTSLTPLLIVAVLAGQLQAEFDSYATSPSSSSVVEASPQPKHAEVGAETEFTTLATLEADTSELQYYDYFVSADTSDLQYYDYFVEAAADVALRDLAEKEALDAENNDTFMDDGKECCAPRNSLYASVTLGGTFAHIRQGGFNTDGGFSGSGPSPLFQDNKDTFDLGGTLGVAIPRTVGRVDGTVRLEVQGMYHESFATELGSFPGAPGPVDFTYQTNMTNRWSTTANMWYDIPIRPLVDFYLGGGIGVHAGTLRTDDTRVSGDENFDDFMWQVGCGIVYHHNDRLSIDLGYRYVDYGSADIGLTTTYEGSELFGDPAGNYKIGLSAHQLMLGFRFNSIQDFLPGH